MSSLRPRTPRLSSLLLSLLACLAAALGSVPGWSADEVDGAGRIRRAAQALAESPYAFEFELAVESPESGESTTRGRAKVAPLGDGSSRYRVEAERVGPEGASRRFVAVDDGETVEVLDETADRLWFTPRYRAGVFLSSEYLGSLIPLALSAAGLERSAGYRSQIGEPVEVDGRACESVKLPLPRGYWQLAFGEGHTPCRFELVTGEGESAARAVLTVGGFSRVPEAASFGIEAGAAAERREFTPGGPAPGDTAPAMDVELATGEVWSLAAQRGRVVVLDFWATWCGPCRSSMKATRSLLDARADAPLVALAANVMDGGDREAFYRELELSYPWAVADDAAAPWGVEQTGLPALFVVGKDGRVVDYFLGALSEEFEQRLAATVDRALAE